MQKAHPACHDAGLRYRGMTFEEMDNLPIMNLLLVTRNRDWAQAVQGAAQQIGGEMSTCLARDAITRLARITSHYSHVLVDGNDADGLFNELADLATEIAEPDTDMFALGRAAPRRRNVRIIRQATPQSVREALMAAPVPRGRPAIDTSELQAVLDGAMIEARYQPIIRMADSQPIGLEALARLNHPDKGTMLPDRFIPQIEDAGLASDLTRVISGRAFADLTGPFLAARNLRMSLNFPLDVLLQPVALDVLEAQREASGIPADLIIIELTESRPVDDFALLGRSLEHVRKLGYGVAIDDVGPAVPRLAPLLELPFTSLKLDKDLVQQILDVEESRSFVGRTIEQAKQRGLFVVAEGVETESHWDQMAAMGADGAQGFLASRPLPVAAVPIWWESWLASARPA